MSEEVNDTPPVSTERPTGNAPSGNAPPHGKPPRNGSPFYDFSMGRLKRLATKELRETLRDRRTIITLILMPLLVYPILSVVFRTVLMSSIESTFDGKPAVLKIVVQSNKSEQFTTGFVSEMRRRVNAFEKADADEETDADKKTDANNKETPASKPAGTEAIASDSTAKANLLSKPTIAAFNKHQWLITDAKDLPALENEVLNSDVSLGVRFDFPQSPQSDRWYQGAITIVQPNTERGDREAAYFREQVERINFEEIASVLKKNGLPDTNPIAINPVIIAKDANAPPTTKTFSLASLIPLILVLMTVTGAVYPAIDLTAGERERGTLETLMAAPVPRLSILLAKFFAVWTVAIFTALLNLIGMAITVWTFQFESILLGAGGFSLSVIFKIFCLLILFSAFFSAVLLAVTSFARSFKEAQAYLIPIILLSMGPGLLAMNPSLTLNGVWAIVPMVNVLLLGRDVISQQVQVLPAVFAVLSTIGYALLAIRFAAQRFGADSILYANQGSLTDLIARPQTTQNYFSTPAATLTLLLMFPLNLVAIGALGRLAKPLSNNYTQFVVLMGAFTILSFFVVPFLMGWQQRVRFRTAFAFRPPKIKFVIPAVALGLFMWPLLATLVDGWYELTGLLVGEEAAKDRQEMLLELTQGQVEKFRQLSPVVVGLAFSIIPAFCEEWFFRGMVLQTWLNNSLRRSPWRAIVFSAVMFGFFHVLSNSAISLDRLLPTTLMGVLLGYVCYRSNSIWPSTILHSLHNGCLVFLGYYQPQLSQLSWFPPEGESIPILWPIVAFVICSIAIVSLAKMSRSSSTEPVLEHA